MIQLLHRNRKSSAIAEVMAIADAHPPLAPHVSRPVRETEEWLFESATEFCAALANIPSALRKLRERTNDNGEA